MIASVVYIPVSAVRWDSSLESMYRRCRRVVAMVVVEVGLLLILQASPTEILRLIR